MKVICQSCQAKYTIADEKVKGRVAKIRCKKCSATIVVDGSAPSGGGIDASDAGQGSELWSVQVTEGDQRDLTVAQIAELWASGTVSLDTYVWRVGFSDWQAIELVPELRAALERGGSAGADVTMPVSIPPPSLAVDASGFPAPSAAPAASPSAEPTPAAVPALPVVSASPAPAGSLAHTPALAPSPPPGPVAPAARTGAAALAPAADAKATAARVDARRMPVRMGATDLFASKTSDDDEVATSAPPKPVVAPASNDKPIGARNENSVLFSLADLTKGASGPAPTGAGGAAKPIPKKVEAESSVVADLKQLLDVNKSGSQQKSNVDEIMNLGGGIFAPALTAPALAPPPVDFGASVEAAAGGGRKRAKTGIIAAGLALVVGAGGATLVMHGSEKAGASTEASASAAAASAAEPSGTAEEQPAATASSETANSADTVAAVAPGALPPGAASAAEDAKEKEKSAAHASRQKKAEEKEQAAGHTQPVNPFAPPPAGGGSRRAGGGGGGAAPASTAEFDRAAALSSLSAAASAAQSCRRPNGPTGSGRIAVTFAQSGMVTTANVEGPPFAGTPVGGCVASKFRGAHVPPFGGGTVTVHKSFFIN